MKTKFGWILSVAIALDIFGCGQIDDERGQTIAGISDSGFDQSQSYAKTLNTRITGQPPLKTQSTTAQFNFTCNNPPCTFQCSLDSAAATKCSSPKTYKKLARGPHYFQVYAVKSGKADLTPAGYDWTISGWAPVTTVSAPAPRYHHTAVWTGSEMIVWGGVCTDTTVGTGGKYNPQTDSWAPTTTVGAPAARSNHTAVWTGTGGRMIVWGGKASAAWLNTGGIYDPETDSWSNSSTANAPAIRMNHGAVWTGTEMMVWGGQTDIYTYYESGGRYDPNSNSWVPISTTYAPEARECHGSRCVVWTGAKMIVWGGTLNNGCDVLTSGGIYDPGSNAWTETSDVNAPIGGIHQIMVWTGTVVIARGGYRKTGGKYNPDPNSWTPISKTNAPDGFDQVGIWTGSKMIIWEMANCMAGCDDNGGIYNPAANSWAHVPLAGGPYENADGGTAIWTGTAMIVWGGDTNNTGHLLWP